MQLDSYIAIISSAINCGDPTANLSLNGQQPQTGSSPSAVSFADTLELICETGSNWNDGELSKTVSCLASGVWQLIPFSCLGIKLLWNCGFYFKYLLIPYWFGYFVISLKCLSFELDIIFILSTCKHSYWSKELHLRSSTFQYIVEDLKLINYVVSYSYSNIIPTP